MDRKTADVVIIGGGILGLSTAYSLLKTLPSLSVVVLEKETIVGFHQTGHNSGVVHSGIYYTPNSLKARLAITGRAKLFRFCENHGIKHDRCGKIVAATDSTEEAKLEELAKRAHRNGIQTYMLSPQAAAELEPHLHCTRALWVPSTGRVDFTAVTSRLSELIKIAGGIVQTGVHVLDGQRVKNEWRVNTNIGPITGRFLVGCAGLQADQIARLTGYYPKSRIIPFRGEYLEIVGSSSHLVRGLIYPVPDPRFPFLGLHLTRGLNDKVHVGPNAVIALAREGYRRNSFSFSDLCRMLFYTGTFQLARRYWQPGLKEFLRSLNRKHFIKAAQSLIPDLDTNDFGDRTSGIRAQAVDKEGFLIDDFDLIEDEHTIQMVNAPSPAATAAFAIGEFVAAKVVNNKVIIS